MRDLTDFFIIAVITGVIVAFSVIQARKEGRVPESATQGKPLKKAS